MFNLSILKYHRRKEGGRGEGVMEEVEEKQEKKELVLVQVWDHSYSYVSGWHELSVFLEVSLMLYSIKVLIFQIM